MLLQFRARNFLSFKEEVTFSFMAAPLREKIDLLNTKPLRKWKDENVLKVAGIFGANGSGKSNLLKAIQFFIETALGKRDEILWQNFRPSYSNPFLLNQQTIQEPTSVEICFTLNNKEYRYGFEFLQEKVQKEWLYEKEQREKRIFFREENHFNYHPNPILNILHKNQMIKSNSLLLTLAHHFNEPTCSKIIEYFRNYKFFDVFDITSYIHGTRLATRLQEEKFRKKILELLKKADFAIENVTLRKSDSKKFPNLGSKELDELLSSFVTKQDLVTHRKIYNNEGELVEQKEFVFSKFESEGTRKFFDLASVALDVFEKGGVLVFDELDTKFHPLLSRYIISLFYNSHMNPLDSQLLFSAHDVSLLDSDLLRRDQIWIAEKNQFGASSLISLHEFKLGDGRKVRNDTSLLKNYLLGKFGGIPIFET